MRVALVLLMLFLPRLAMAEGRCPPGQYPIGGQGVGGCAPIATGDEADAPSPKPTGKWETRWGAIVEDADVLATGVADTRKSKRDATSAATKECERLGGKKCKLRIAYYNQCVAMADPTVESRKRTPGQSTANAEETLELAKSKALQRFEAYGSGQDCTIVYSACSMSEFKKF